MVKFGQIADLKRQPVVKRMKTAFPIPMQQQMEQGMPATSKRQFRFMEAVAHGGIKKPGLSEAKAAEYVSGQSPKSLPESAPKRRYKPKYPRPDK